jgi:dihydroorotate dehydrogenase (fumarate)
MDLSTTYLGLNLPHPIMPGASPLVDDFDNVRRLEDAGAAAITLNSIFEEQILSEQFREVQDVEVPEETFAEALTYHPHRDEFTTIGPDLYLDRVRKIKEITSVPVIASLNGISTTAWIEYATKCEQAGADKCYRKPRFGSGQGGKEGCRCPHSGQTLALLFVRSEPGQTA